MERITVKASDAKVNNIVSSPPFPRKSSRNNISISLPDSLSYPLTSNLRDSLEFFTCHSCGIVDSGLRVLDSQWRVVLVCKGCHDRIRSAAVCSYCFSIRDSDVLVCRRCWCRVHLRCVHIQRGYITLSEFDPVSFTCIDCCAIPKPQFRNLLRSRVLLEELVRSVSSTAKKKVVLATKARMKALKKADDARVAMELAFDAILFARDAVIANEQLALQPPLAINGSTMVLRRTRQSNMVNFIPIKKDYCTGVVSSMGRKPRKWRGSFHEKFGVCRKDDSVFESNRSSLSERKSYTKPRIAMTRKLLEIDADCVSDSTGIASAKKARHFDSVLNCDVTINDDGLALVSCRESADSNSLMEISECRIGAGENSSNTQDGCDVPVCNEY